MGFPFVAALPVVVFRVGKSSGEKSEEFPTALESALASFCWSNCDRHTIRLATVVEGKECEDQTIGLLRGVGRRCGCRRGASSAKRPVDNGRVSGNVEPTPTSLSRVRSAPIPLARPRLIANPRPVPSLVL